MRGALEEPFVGRAEELAVLAECLGEARHLKPRVVVIEGEPGIGKSTLLTRFIRSFPQAVVLRATGDEAESLVSFGVVRQLLASGRRESSRRPSLAGHALDDEADPLRIGNELADILHGAGRGGDVVVVAIDDLHCTDRESAVALRLAMRRVHHIRLLALLASRSGQSIRLGEDWARFVSGDHRVTRLRITGLGRRELMSLGETLGAGRLSSWAAGRLLAHTGGNPLHCCALLEELDSDAWARPDRLPAPRALAGVVLARLGKLSGETQQLVSATAVLGRRCPLDTAAAVAGLTDPITALDEAVEAGLLAETREGPAAEISFTHALIQRAVYDDLGPARRRRIHHAAVGFVGPLDGLVHRVAAAHGPDGDLAADLEAAAVAARHRGSLARAASWFAQAAAASGTSAEQGKRAIAGLEMLVQAGDVAEAEALLASFGDLAPSARLSGITGDLDLLAGRCAASKERLLAAWESHDRTSEPLVGARAAFLLATTRMLDGHLAEAIEWTERAAAAAATDPPLRRQAAALSAMITVMDGREAEGLALLDFMPAVPSEVPVADTELLVSRGMAKLLTDDLDAVIADLSTAAARLQSGGSARIMTQCLCWLADAEYNRGDWDGAVLHAELAVRLAQDADRVWDLCFAHAHAARVAAARGVWAVAAPHVEASREAASRFGVAMALTASATATASLAAARGHHEEVVRSAASVRAVGPPRFFGRRAMFEWRSLEIDALISLDEIDRANGALCEFEHDGRSTQHPAELVTTARLRGNLAKAQGDMATAEHAFRQAWHAAGGLRMPFQLARLELDDACRLRHAGRPAEAVGRLQSARARFGSLGARPYLELCDRQLAACGMDARAKEALPGIGLTRSEMAVARLVAKGRSNREVAAELFLSVKTVEFHLRHIFAKLEIRGRRDLATLVQETRVES